MSPIYEYRCQSCGHLIERLQTFDESPDNRCPNCGKNELKKQVSLSSFQLKGKGWYKTDYAKKDSSKTETSDKKDSTKNSSPKTKELKQNKTSE